MEEAVAASGWVAVARGSAAAARGSAAAATAAAVRAAVETTAVREAAASSVREAEPESGSSTQGTAAAPA